MAWPIGAARPLSGSSSAMRVLPDGVTGEPTDAFDGRGRGGRRASLGLLAAGAQQKSDGGKREEGTGASARNSGERLQMDGNERSQASDGQASA